MRKREPIVRERKKIARQLRRQLPIAAMQATQKRQVLSKMILPPVYQVVSLQFRYLRQHGAVRRVLLIS